MERPEWNMMRRAGLINCRLDYGKESGYTGGGSNARPFVPPSDVLKLAFTVYLKNKHDDMDWVFASQVLNFRQVTCDRKTRLEFLETDYWREVEGRAKDMGIILANYPLMDKEASAKALREEKGD